MNIINELKTELENKLKILNNTKLSSKHLFRASNLNKEDFLKYLKSFKGYKGRVYGVKSMAPASNLKVKSNKFLELQNQLIKPNSSHKPMNNSKVSWYGVEIECLFPCEETEDECSNCDGSGCSDCDDSGRIQTKNEDGAHDLITRQLRDILKLKRVNFKSDGSIRESEGFIGIEFNVLCSSIDGFDNLKKLCSWLNSVGAKVNKSCGLHVHLDQRLASKSEIRLRYTNLTRCVKAMAEIVPESRKNNTYCGLRGSMTDRYSAVNGSALKKYNTIEIRLHSSTIEFNKIRNWIELLDLIQNAPKKTISQNVDTLEDLFMTIDVPEKLIDYCLMRRDKFMGKVECQETNDSEILAGPIAA